MSTERGFDLALEALASPCRALPSIEKRDVTPFYEDQAAVVRRVLRIGLTCYGEIEQRRNAMALYETFGEKLPADLRVLHPTGTSDVVSDFAAALCYLG